MGIRGESCLGRLATAFTVFLFVAGGLARADDLGPELGAFFSDDRAEVTFRIYAPDATHVRLDLFDQTLYADEVAAHFLKKDAAHAGVWMLTLTQAELPDVLRGKDFLNYGYRMWGPNWHFEPAWRKGTEIGFVADVDSEGHRFNPNKLLSDPEARELSHDPVTPAPPRFTRPQTTYEVYLSGPDHRHQDSGPVAPKTVLFVDDDVEEWPEPAHHPADDWMYEVHVRGFTKADPSVPPEEQGTYAGAARKAAYLAELGVRTVKFLPVAESQNDTNDILRDAAGNRTTDGMQYWGYMPLAYNAVEKRYATYRSRQTPGGATREFRAMVKEFNRHGINVVIDVVYNHTGEGGVVGGDPNVATLNSFRGIANSVYYQISDNPGHYWDTTGCGNNFNAGHPFVRKFIRRSVIYWRKKLRVNGFRFDLAAQLGNTRTRSGYHFDKMDGDNVLNGLRRDLPGVPLIAEPWNYGYQEEGNFPEGWHEWNAEFRRILRRHQNKREYETITPAQLANVFSGTWYLFETNGRKPYHSVNYLAAHDGFTEAGLYRFNEKQNDRPWPAGPSDGGESRNDSWDQGGEPRLQRQATRNCILFLAMSAGVPMMTGGAEFLRALENNNPWNVDTEANWLDWVQLEIQSGHYEFTKNAIAFRWAHPALRPREFAARKTEWYMPNGQLVSPEYWHDAQRGFLGMRVLTPRSPTKTKSIYFGYNGHEGSIDVNLPKTARGKKWLLAADTSADFERSGNFRPAGQETLWDERSYRQSGRSVVVLIEK